MQKCSWEKNTPSNSNKLYFIVFLCTTMTIIKNLIKKTVNSRSSSFQISIHFIKQKVSIALDVIDTEIFVSLFILHDWFLVIFGFEVQNIFLAVTDYCKYDKITNIERVTPQNVTFPAVTVCARGYDREYFYTNKSVHVSRVYPQTWTWLLHVQCRNQ